MANTYFKIGSVTVGAGGASTLGFTSIPSTYTDLVLKLSIRGTANASGSDKWRDISIGFNGAGSNVSITNRVVYGLGNAVGSTTGTVTSGGAMPTADATASTFSNTEIYIPNYAGSANKSFSIDFVTENNATRAVSALLAGLWSNTAAITSVTFYPDSGNFAEYTTGTLYGIKNS
jgi:hypothetical protein